MSLCAPAEIRVFALKSSQALGAAMCRWLNLPLGLHEERDFEDGEHKSRPLESVRGKDVYVIASLHTDIAASVNDKLCRLLFFLGAMRDAGAARLTAVVPYLCYARKDRRTKPRDPVTSRYVAQLFEAIGIERVLTLDVHNLAAYENAFRICAEHLEARLLFADYFALLLAERKAVVVSPDAGGMKRAERFRQALERRLGRGVELAFMEKQRSEGKLSGEAFAGEVAGCAAVIIDDLIAGGSTMARAAGACLARGASTVYAAATHGAFAPEAGEVLARSSIERIVITNTVYPLRIAPELLGEKLVVLDIAPLFAEAIRRLHGDGSMTELIEG